MYVILLYYTFSFSQSHEPPPGRPAYHNPSTYYRSPQDPADCYNNINFNIISTRLRPSPTTVRYRFISFDKNLQLIILLFIMITIIEYKIRKSLIEYLSIYKL